MNEDQNGNPTLQGGSSAPDTSGDQDPTPPQSNTEHGENGVQNSSTPSDDHGTVSKEDYQRLQAKVSKLEKQVSTSGKANTQQQQPTPQGGYELSEDDRVKAYQMFNGNPALYENWRRQWVARGGRDYGSYSDVFGSNNGGTPANNTNQNSNTDDTSRIDFIVEVKSFVKEHPEFDVDDAADDDEREAREANLEFVFRTAHQRQELAERRGKPISRNQAIQQALVALDPDKYLNQERENGRLAGAQDALSKGTGSGVGSGSAKGKGREIGLTDEERDIAKQLGISEEQMLEQKKRDSDS